MESEPEHYPRPLAGRLDALEGVGALREAAERASAPAYLVGGSVRDLLLGADRVDIDVAVEGDPVALARALGGKPRVHERFATATVALDGHTVDLAATRAESYSRAGALPTVRPAPLADDLSRRDFTVNAMAVPLLGDPELIDLHGGLDDLRAGILRDLHPRSFIDDPTRALRAGRYAARLGFVPEPGTLERLRAADLGTVSAERVEAELRRLAAERSARRGFELLAEWGLVALAATAGELIDGVIEASAGPGWPEVDRRADAVLAAARGEHGPDKLVTAVPASPSEAVRFARGHGPVDLLLARAGGAVWLDRYVADWSRVRLAIDGRDLLGAGVPEGPAIGRGLAAALDAKLDGVATDREAELRIALAAAAAGS
ncbi:MAG TPA: hypothetical protein VK919_04565 [Solirubrobacterales bacterium]|nr:hypothetical protein [Solirubrobacterales bacterium]